MKPDPTHLRVENASELGRMLRSATGPAPALLLSASVPYLRAIGDDLNPAERKLQQQRNRRYLETAEPARIRSAVLSLTRAALLRGMRLVFGAHPAISPMVLSAARGVGAKPRSILIFQSDLFENSLPSETLKLSNWAAGTLVFTPRSRARRASDIRKESLTLMRKLMVNTPGMRGAVFVGGMEGVEEEAGLFRETHPRLRRYAIASTGSAARGLFKREPEKFAGALEDPEVLEDGRSYSLIARLILEDLGMTTRDSRNRSE